MTELCGTCGPIPDSTTRRHPDNLTVLCCKLCGNSIRKIPHPAEAA